MHRASEAQVVHIASNSHDFFCGRGIFFTVAARKLQSLHISVHGNRILFLSKTEEYSFQGVGREAGSVAFAAETIFKGSIR
jgi:hypothetical protein